MDAARFRSPLQTSWLSKSGGAPCLWLRWPPPHFQVREDEPAPRVGAGLHRTPRGKEEVQSRNVLSKCEAGHIAEGDKALR